MPRLIFGGGTIGDGTFSTVEDIDSLLEVLQASKIEVIDTAPVYPGVVPGASERLLGAAKAAEKGFVIDTKVKVTGDGPGQGSLTKDAINESVSRSLETLGESQVDVLYCHIPDTVTPIEETAATLHEHWSRRHCKKIGLSNYSVAQVLEFMSVCDKDGLVKPTVYQGQYNAICRKSEDDLLPMLRKHGMSFVAFSPLAGGFLTGNLSLGNDISGTRFAEGNLAGDHYRRMYDKQTIHSAVKELHAFMHHRGIALAEASLRWLYYHSALGDEDGVILGATRTAQVEKNVNDIKKGPLAEDIVQMFEKTWNMVKESGP